MKLHEKGEGFWRWMSKKGYAVTRGNGPYSGYPAATAKCGAVFPKQALIGYLLEYCFENGRKVTFYYLTDMRLDDIYSFLVDIVTGEKKIRNA